MTNSKRRRRKSPFRPGVLCHYCGRPLQNKHKRRGDFLTRDHTEPKSRGGITTVPCCRRCNQLKGCLTYTAFVDMWHGKWDQMPDIPFPPGVYLPQPNEHLTPGQLVWLVEPDGCRVTANVVRLKDPALALKSVCVDVFGHEHWAAASQIKRYREYGNPTDQ